MRRIGVIMIVGASALFGVSCGDDDNDSGSGVSGKKLLTELTAKDLKALCEASRDRAHESLRNAEDYCFRAYVSSGEYCEDDLAECKASGEYESELEDDWDCETYELEDLIDPDGRCTATVADYEECDRAWFAAERKHYEKVSCDAPSSTFEGPDAPAVCEKVLSACPALQE